MGRPSMVSTPASLSTYLLSAALGLYGCAQREDAVIHGPAVQPPPADGVRVALETAGDVRLVFDLAAPGGRLERSIEEASPSRRHVFTVNALAPDTRYAYRLLGVPGGQAIAEGSAATLPPQPSRPIRVAVIGDSGPLGFLRPKPQWSVAAAAADWEPDLVLHTGDVVYSRRGEPLAELAEAYFQPFARLVRSTPVYLTPGNHDEAMGGCAPYLRAFDLPEGPEGERYYSFDYGPTHFASIDTSSLKTFNLAQLEWLARDLAASRLPWKVVFTHHPPLGMTETGVRDDPEVLAPLLEICGRAGVRLVLAGHVHAYLRYRPLELCPGGLTLIVSGGGGATLVGSIAPDSRLARAAIVHHHVRLRIGVEGVEIEAVDLEGKVFDRVTIEP